MFLQITVIMELVSIWSLVTTLSVHPWRELVDQAQLQNAKQMVSNLYIRLT